MLQGLELERAPTIAEADFILNTGPWGWEETADNYAARLAEARARDLPMVCANPDLVVMHKSRAMICAGTLAEQYEAIGGRVAWHGKPFGAVYESCFACSGPTTVGASSPSATVCAPTSPAPTASASTCCSSPAASTPTNSASTRANSPTAAASPRRSPRAGRSPPGSRRGSSGERNHPPHSR